MTVSWDENVQYCSVSERSASAGQAGITVNNNRENSAPLNLFDEIIEFPGTRFMNKFSLPRLGLLSSLQLLGALFQSI
jgi:hypothetical protein